MDFSENFINFAVYNGFGQNDFLLSERKDSAVLQVIKISYLTMQKSSEQFQPDLLFETSWEVCNKVGGIYTVLSTKARELKKTLGDKLIFIGPDVWSEQVPSPTFIERKTLLKNASSSLNLPNDITIRTGRWDIPGSPVVILVKFQNLMGHMNDTYGEMWNEYGVDSLHAYGDYEEACSFAVASAKVIEALSKHLGADESKVIAHFDEWTTGMGLLYIKSHMPQAATIFTTHATSIGRSICGNGKALYEYFDGYNGDQMAGELNMESKHSLEKAAAHNADCFTTVSEVTGKECTQLLDITPQVITPNGFEPDFLPGSRTYSRQRKEGREKLLRIASCLTGKEYPEDTFIIATAGRNEYRNKGLDLFIDSMVTLGEEYDKAGKEILSFILVPAWVKEPAGELLMDLYHSGNDRPEADYLTHRLNNEDYDSVCCRLRNLNVEHRGGNVKIIYVPCYLDAHDGIVNISYYDLLPALDLTVFASYYEPWGYTPLESVAFGVPTITTDKAGFGQWVLSNLKNSLNETGVFVLPRTDSNYNESCHNIAKAIDTYLAADAAEAKATRDAAAATARKADWQYFIKDYYEAFKVALKNASARNKK